MVLWVEMSLEVGMLARMLRIQIERSFDRTGH